MRNIINLINRIMEYGNLDAINIVTHDKLTHNNIVMLLSNEDITERESFILNAWRLVMFEKATKECEQAYEPTEKEIVEEKANKNSEATAILNELDYVEKEFIGTFCGMHNGCSCCQFDELAICPVVHLQNLNKDLKELFNHE